MAQDQVVLRFSEVTFAFDRKVLLDETSFSIRKNARIALMGQNGAGKSTLFKMITNELKPDRGSIHITPKETTIATSRQVMKPEYLELTLRGYFETAFEEVQRNLDKLIADVLEVVNLDIDTDKLVSDLSGGQQARLLLAHALIQNPDILLLDEPTNNLDQEGIDHLTMFLILYEKTCIVISHDADFLNSFTDGVLYLDSFSHKMEQYTGNYLDVVEEIAARVKKEQLLNVRAETNIKKLKAQAGVFAHKGGKLRGVAKKMRDAAQEAEEGKVDVRREDKTIKPFSIGTQQFDAFFDGKIAEITSVSLLKKRKPVTKKLDLTLRRGTHLLIAGPNGIGKSTFLEALATEQAEGVTLAEGLKIGYYRQDFSTLDFNQKAYDSLIDVMGNPIDQNLREVASKFLLDGKLLDQTIRDLSEGQKGLLSFARLVLQKPGLLILDEPTNHINFRHLPIIAKALDEYEGAMIVVSHLPDFIEQIRIDETLDLGKI
jgi:ATP-binding cassette, subfamily F, member 3